MTEGLDLVHYSDKPILDVRSVEQSPTFHGGRKPQGLWVSVEGNDDGWREWCESEAFRVECLAVRNVVKITPSARLLVLSGASALRRFSLDYRVERKWPHHNGIDWPRIATEYHGIIIAPYVWECRLSDDTFWYYSWDCASGCIWDATAIASITPETATPAGRLALQKNERS